MLLPLAMQQKVILVVDTLPTVENDEFKYLVYNDEYYVWNREFDWSIHLVGVIIN